MGPKGKGLHRLDAGSPYNRSCKEVITESGEGDGNPVSQDKYTKQV